MFSFNERLGGLSRGKAKWKPLQTATSIVVFTIIVVQSSMAEIHAVAGWELFSFLPTVRALWQSLEPQNRSQKQTEV